MQKKPVICLVLILIIGVSLSYAEQFAFAKKPIEFNLSHVFSAVSYPHLCLQYYSNKIHERTNGRVKITVHAAGVLVPQTKIFDSIKSGINHLGFHSISYTPGPFPASEACVLPLPAKNAWSYSHMVDSFWSDLKPKEIKDVKYCFAGTPGPYVIATVDKPVLKPEDLKGLKIRAIGSPVDLVKMWGGTPVSIAMGDVYEALSKGLIDGGILPFEAIAGFKFGESLKYVTIAPVGTSSPGFVVMNSRTWKKLPEDIKDVFNATNREMQEWYSSAFQYADLQGRKYFQSLSGRKILKIPEENKEEWIRLAEPVTEKYVSEKNAMGLPAADYVQYLLERGKYWNRKYPGDAKIGEWIEKELKKEQP